MKLSQCPLKCIRFLRFLGQVFKLLYPNYSKEIENFPTFRMSSSKVLTSETIEICTTDMEPYMKTQNKKLR